MPLTPGTRIGVYEVAALIGAGGMGEVSSVSHRQRDGHYLYLKYYADEDWRAAWLADFPDYDMPAHENPPHDRDHRMPQPPEFI